MGPRALGNGRSSLSSGLVRCSSRQTIWLPERGEQRRRTQAARSRSLRAACLQDQQEGMHTVFHLPQASPLMAVCLLLPGFPDNERILQAFTVEKWEPPLRHHPPDGEKRTRISGSGPFDPAGMRSRLFIAADPNQKEFSRIRLQNGGIPFFPDLGNCAARRLVPFQLDNHRRAF